MHDAANDLNACGIRCTPQRLEVYSALQQCCGHPTAEELHRLVTERRQARGEAGSVSLATVYNTLEALCGLGLARRLPGLRAGLPGALECRASRYEAAGREHYHAYTPDGAAHDIPADLGRRMREAIPEDLLREFEERTGLKASRIVIEVESEGPWRGG